MTDNLRYLSSRSLVTDFTLAEREALDRVNAKIAAAKNLEEAMAFLFEVTRSISPCDRIGLSFIEDDRRRIVAHQAIAAYEPLLLGQGYAEDLRGSSLERVIDDRTPRIIDDLEEYLASRPNSPSTKLLVREGVRSSMTCPLFVDAIDGLEVQKMVFSHLPR